jgi:hypothetical protein
MCWAATVGSDSSYIRSIVKSTTINCIKDVTTKANLNHIIFKFIAITISDNIVAVTRTNSNPSTNSCTIVNRGIKRATINSIYNREFDNASIWSTSKTNYRINKVDCCIDKSDFLITRS